MQIFGVSKASQTPPFQAPQPPGKPRWSLPILWMSATVLLCGIFVLISIPPADAQNQDQKRNQRYFYTLRDVFEQIQKLYVEEVDPKVLFDGAMTGMFNALGDPYSTFLSEKDMAELNETTQGSFGGVGLYISKPTEARPDGTPPYVEVAAPIEDTPGWKAKIEPGDLIIAIDDTPTDTLSMDEVLLRLRGAPGAAVKLLIRRVNQQGAKLEFPVTLLRAIIEVPTTKHAMIDRIGYLKLITFTPKTVERAVEAITEFQSRGYTGLILDLRNNYGGLLSAAVGVCDLFLKDGVIVSTKSRIKDENIVFTAKKPITVEPDIPVVVLINKGSASASEIVAGALKDRHRAYLVGEKSYGKGSVQQVYDLKPVGFKITVARYYTPSDVNIDKIGIPPDQEVTFPEFTDADAATLNQLIASNRIPWFIKANPQATAEDIAAFAEELAKAFPLDHALLRRLIRNEQQRNTIAPIYDLEYDVQLQAAVRILESGSYKTLLRTSKTLKALQEEADAAAFPKAS